MGNNGGIYISYLIALFVNQPCRLFQKKHTVCTFVFFIGIGEMLSDIAKCRRTKKSINHCMNKHIGIAMPQKPFFVRDFDAAYYKVAVFNQSVCIKSCSDSHGESTPSFATFSKDALGGYNILCCGKLQILIASLHYGYACTHFFHEGAIVGFVKSVFVICLQNFLTLKALRGLNQHR